MSPRNISPESEDMIIRHGLSRRSFLKFAAAGTAGLAAAPLAASLHGCVPNPVTGESQLMLMSKEQEISLDKQYAPHQFSADYGPVRHNSVNNYISSVGSAMAGRTHRPDMPYNFRAVNANHVNAYAFPGGSIACTRGIMLGMESEAELSALLGHELGHVAARHAASRMTQSMLAKLAVAGVSAVAASQNNQLGSLAAGLGGIGAGMLLARYSRGNERQADELGMEYMARSGYSPKGMIDLMDMLRSMNKREPSAIDLMFATHPMSSERYQTAVNRSRSQYGQALSKKISRERYMDSIAPIRRDRAVIDALQAGEREMRKDNFQQAERHIRNALRKDGSDYAGLLVMAKCKLAQKQYKSAANNANRARRVYPSEPQALHVLGISRAQLKDYDGAFSAFNAYDKRLPGNPNTTFMQGYCQEHMGHRKNAAQYYMEYLKADKSSDQAKYAYDKLRKWGYVKG